MSNPILKKTPPFRKLKGYAFDPSLSLKIDTATINNMVYTVDWEEKLFPGPIGEYLEVIDYDPTVDKFYRPVDLNDTYILAQDGLDPSESNPCFHQQMVYAVAMTTIKNFEKALGRPILWSKRRNKDNQFIYVPKLRIYPHAFRDANALYSPQKKALLFGYFDAEPANVVNMMPNHRVFTCLSHDIIAHETTHAILDGMYTRYIEDTNPDMLAFHEAFADIVALFQHFSFPEVLKHQIAKTRGNLESENLLGQLAQQFGSAIGGYGALRDALGAVNPETGKWELKQPNGDEYQNSAEEHDRGSILVAAVFEAFLTIYKNRIADLMRIASGGSGILPLGELHPDLVNRLASEASKVAGQVLKMCIRALDYCPPVDVNFGDYLRAIITADVDLVSDDNKDYRLAFIDAFRRRGIYPEEIKSLSVESLCYDKCKDSSINGSTNTLTNFLRNFAKEVSYAKNRKEIDEITNSFITGKTTNLLSKQVKIGLFKRLGLKFDDIDDFQKLTGLVFNSNWKNYGVETGKYIGGPKYAVQSLKYAGRVGPNGNKSNQVIVSLTQYAKIRVEDSNGTLNYFPVKEDEPFKPDGHHYQIFGGVTLVFDLDSLKLKYAIKKNLIDTNSLNSLDKKRISQMIRYCRQGHYQVGNYKANFCMGRQFKNMEPFHFIHQH